jgi:AraC family transcriptional regulator
MTTDHRTAAEWYMQGRLSPYVREQYTFDGSCHLFESAQPAGDMSDPPVSDLILIQAASNQMRQRSDLGSGRFSDTASKGDLFLIPPGVKTDIHVDNPHVIRVFALPSLGLRALLQDARPNRDPFDFGRLHRGHFNDPQLQSLADQFWARAQSDDATSRLFADGAVLLIAAHLCRLADTPLVARGGLAPWQVRRCTDYLNDHACENVGLEELAALVGLSPFHFARAFKQSTGMPPHRYQMQQRIKLAKTLLELTEMPVTEIAFDVGYESSQALARLFQREVGLSPSDYRRAKGGGSAL